MDADSRRGSVVALVTGSTRGIGAEVARQLGARGYRVIVTGRHAEHRLDVSDPSSVEAIARYVESEFGRLDVLVNNAAILVDEGANALRSSRVLVNCADPGWVRTDMGGRSAPRSVAEGADTIVWLATLPDDGPTGGFFHDRKPMAW